jgi:hypothetical protein
MTNPLSLLPAPVSAYELGHMIGTFIRCVGIAGMLFNMMRHFKKPSFL